MPPDVAPIAIGSDTQLNLSDGGNLGYRFQSGLAGGGSSNIEVNITGGAVGEDFDANAGSTVNISGGEVGLRFNANTGSHVNISGGNVNNGFEVFGSQVSISGGTVGSAFDAWDGSQVTIAGGSVGGRFDAHSGSVVVVSGGSVGTSLTGSSFYARPGSQVSISGGTVGRLLARAGSQVNISGGEFLVDGLPVAGTTVSLTGMEVFTGVLPDGSPFIFSPEYDDGLIGGDILDGVTLISAAVPALDTTPIIIDGPNAPSGLRVGQTLTVMEGGVLANNFAAVRATLHIEGGQVGHGLEVVDSEVNIRQGMVGRYLAAYSGSQVNISGGVVGDFFTAYAGSQVTISGGAVEFQLRAISGSEVTVSGGTVPELSSAGEAIINGGDLDRLSIVSGGHASMSGGTVDRLSVGGHVEISGGNVNGIFVSSGRELELIGREFLLSGLPIAGLDMPGDSLVLDARGGQLLTGLLADGQAFGFTLMDTFGPPFDFYFPADAVLRLTLVPEPTALLLVVCVGGIVLTGARRRSHSYY